MKLEIGTVLNRSWICHHASVKKQKNMKHSIRGDLVFALNSSVLLFFKHIFYDDD